MTMFSFRLKFLMLWLLTLYQHCRSLSLPQALVLPQNASIGHVLVDLSDCSHNHTAISLKTGDFSQYFAVDEKWELVTTRSISTLVDRSPILELVFTELFRNGTVRKRMESLQVAILPWENMVRFKSPVHHGKIYVNSPAHSLVLGLERIELASKYNDLRASIVSGNGNHLFEAVKSDSGSLGNSSDFIRCFTAKRLSYQDFGSHSLVLRVDGHPDGNFATTQLHIEVVVEPNAPPVFEAKRFVKSVFNDLSLGTTVLRVNAHGSGSGIIAYQLESVGYIPFDIDPITADIFTTDRLLDGRYEFTVIASDILADDSRSQMPVKIIVGPRYRSIGKVECNDKFGCEKGSRIRRQSYAPLLLKLDESTRVGILPYSLDLGHREVVKKAPVETKYVTIYENGTMELHRPLNYELDKVVEFAVIVENTQTLGKHIVKIAV